MSFSDSLSKRSLPSSYQKKPLRLARRIIPGASKNHRGANMESPTQANLEEIKLEWVSKVTSMMLHPHWGANFAAGITTAAVAIPLNVALAVSANLPASTGLFSGAIAGVISSFFGASEFQVSGPAAALNMFVFAVAQKYGAEGVAAAAILSGILQLVLGIFGVGKLMKYIPEPVLIGFTTGVGLKLLDTQIPILFGINQRVDEMIFQFFNPQWLFDVSWPNFICGVLVILFVLFGRSYPKVPASIIGIMLSTQLAIYLGWEVNKIGEIPAIDLSWSIPSLSHTHWLEILSLAVPLGLLSGIETLLSAQAVDRSTATRHNSNLELLGQGAGNFFSGLLGGMPTSGVIVRSNVNIQSGSKGRLSGIIHGVVLLGSALFLGGILKHVPVAALAGLLVVIGFRLVEIKEFYHLLIHNKIHLIGFISALVGTVTNHLTWGLGIGIGFVLFFEWLGKELASKKFEKSPVQESPKEKKSFYPERENYPSMETTVSQWSQPAKQLFVRGENWLRHLSESSFVPESSFVHPGATVIGRVILGRQVHIAADTSIRADEGSPFYIGDNSNIQDGVVMHALKSQWIRVGRDDWAIYIGKHVSVAHQALVHGPCWIGDNCFIGFKAVVHNSTLGDHCYVGIGATVVGVKIPPFRYIPHGAVIDSEEKVQKLDSATEHHLEFNHDVVEVNRGLVAAYSKINQLKNKSLTNERKSQ